jgi:vacuolar-type H+-ATPase subunit I/STV1
MFLYGFLFSYSNSTFESTEENGGMLLVSIMGLMLVVGKKMLNKGFGLMNSYVLKSSATGLIYTMLAVVLTLQHYFLFRAFWNRAGTNLPSSEQDFSAERYDNITFSNYFTDLQTSYVLTSASFVDAIACCLSILVALNTVIGRVGVF